MKLRLYQLVEIHEGHEDVYINTPKTLDDFLIDWDDSGFAEFYGDDYAVPDDGITREWLENLRTGNHYLAGDICSNFRMYISVHEINIEL
jgi:hypothetical protein